MSWQVNLATTFSFCLILFLLYLLRTYDEPYDVPPPQINLTVRRFKGKRGSEAEVPPDFLQEGDYKGILTEGTVDYVVPALMIFMTLYLVCIRGCMRILTLVFLPFYVLTIVFIVTAYGSQYLGYSLDIKAACLGLVVVVCVALAATMPLQVFRWLRLEDAIVDNRPLDEYQELEQIFQYGQEIQDRLREDAPQEYQDYYYIDPPRTRAAPSLQSRYYVDPPSPSEIRRLLAERRTQEISAAEADDSSGVRGEASSNVQVSGSEEEVSGVEETKNNISGETEERAPSSERTERSLSEYSEGRPEEPPRRQVDRPPQEPAQARRRRGRGRGRRSQARR